jgi:hypothetical protein
MNYKIFLGKSVIVLIGLVVLNLLTKMGQNLYKGETFDKGIDSFHFPIIMIPFAVSIAVLLLKKEETKKEKTD